ncbi:hypothetical protein MPLA_950015 [Mesorhizobium sp. ORS 3359]|nr:hypothetical protein MPLA_950015 [Mesorhizobium sp. ORS 3359]
MKIGGGCETEVDVDKAGCLYGTPGRAAGLPARALAASEKPCLDFLRQGPDFLTLYSAARPLGRAKDAVAV